jgi:hypothetical protein
MDLHQFPWPRTQLEQLGETQVELRITLSYYFEPNPRERGCLRRHRYGSHALRFAAKRELESVDEFRGRINAAAEAEEVGRRRRPLVLGSYPPCRIHSFRPLVWECSGSGEESAIGVYPIGGWWKKILVMHDTIVALRSLWATKGSAPRHREISEGSTSPAASSRRWSSFW